MKALYKIKKGLDLHLEGEAAHKVRTIKPSAVYALSPDDFNGIVPRVVVKEGQHVDAGDPLFVDKATEKIHFVSPVSGTVAAIVRGDRRKLLHVSVQSDGKQTCRQDSPIAIDKASGSDILASLLKAGLFAFVRQRPYDVIASPEVMPKAIFVSAFSKMPLAADFSFAVEGHEDDFKTGLRALAKMAPVHLGISPEQINTPLLPVKEVQVSVFAGPNPAGNVGVHINHVDPINKGEVVWTLDPGAVVMIGRYVATGRVIMERRIAVAGSGVTEPDYADVLVGTPIADLLDGRLTETDRHMRIINGNPLVGYKSEKDGFLGAFSREVCVIPEGDDVDEVLGWIMPRTNDFSTNHSYFSWLQGRSRRYDLDCRIKGGERHMIMSGEYERVFPMDIFPEHLVKAIITGDIDKQEELGIYEVAPEDFAVAEFVDSSKLELQRIVREGLDLLRKENA